LVNSQFSIFFMEKREFIFSLFLLLNVEEMPPFQKTF
jgi:hypothetical protein